MEKLIKGTAAYTTVCGNICELSEETLEDIIDADYHHNTSYAESILICEHGILSLDELNKRGIRHDSKELLEKLSDIESHPNGTDGIALANEEPHGRSGRIYDPFNPTVVDFRVSNTVPAYHTSYHYDNELVCRRSIGLDEIKSIDIRIRKLCDLLLYTRKLDASKITRETIVKNYNYLIELAQTLVRKELNIPLREMSDNEAIYIIDTQRLAEKPRLSIR